MLPWRRLPVSGAVPPARTLLRYVYIGRLAIAFGVFIGAALAWFSADITQLFVASLSITLALVVTSWAAWYTFLRTGEISQTFLYVQAIFDVALTAAVVHVMGPYSTMSALYILVIAVYAVVMPFANGMLIALLAGFMYALIAVIADPDPTFTLALQIGVFWVVALATGYIASRVRVAGQAQEALSAELTRVRLEAGDILRNIRTGILTISGDGRLVYANPTAEQLLGIDVRELRERPILARLDAIAPVLADAVRSTSWEGRRVVRREGEARVGGRTFPLGVSTTAVSLDDGQPPSVTAIFKDISDEKRYEELHLRAERLTAVAEIAASLAHEIKNPLASIRSAVELLARSAPHDGDERVLSGLVLRESDRLARLLTEFMDFSRVRVTRPAEFDLVAVAEAGIRIARQHPDCPGAAVVELTAAQRPLVVEGDEDLMHRVVFNLVLNAIQIAGDGARVAVEVAVPDPRTFPANVAIEHPVMVRVRDNGPGVNPDILPRLFEPFVTARPGGTGLGLAIVQRAVLSHRGVIFCDSEPGQGATFTVYLPSRFSAEEGV